MLLIPRLRPRRREGTGPKVNIKKPDLYQYMNLSNKTDVILPGTLFYLLPHPIHLHPEVDQFLY